jgi:hypothetical protein
MNEKKKVTKSLVEAQVKGEMKVKDERKDTRIQKQVETDTRYYSQENSQGICPKCKSDCAANFVLDDFTDEGDGVGVLYIGLTCKKCGLAFQDVWEAHYAYTEGEEEVVIGDVSNEDNDGDSNG